MDNPPPPGLGPLPLPIVSSQQLCRSVPQTPDPFWQRSKLRAHLVSLLQNVELLKSIGWELEAIQAVDRPSPGSQNDSSLSTGAAKESAVAEQTSKDGLSSQVGISCSSASQEILCRTVQENIYYWPESASFASQAARQLLRAIKVQLDPLKGVLDGSAGHERALSTAKLASSRKKLIRNRKWRSHKRRRVAEALRKERECYDNADREADEWRAREIAKVIARRKMEKMKELAEKASREEKARQQEQVEIGLLVEKLQELRALRIMKLKKQGRFFPEEDDQFIERVRAAVEEEECQAAAAANTSAAAVAILNAEEARQAGTVSRSELKEKVEPEVLSVLQESIEHVQKTGADLKSESAKSYEGKVNDPSKETRSNVLEGYEGLPPEFHHYYFGSYFDMGTLIEVRHGWDAFIMPGGRFVNAWKFAKVECSCLTTGKAWEVYLLGTSSSSRVFNLVQ